ncbi:hypothetical protein CYV19_17020 [Natronobacterium gregoryi SP2]|uniref:Uncharacterized protein n=1 Tax=Natronobacterium gregoryi (strain ATCC 43098 / DSM 3393 / CCM 3738 / CIP 104747 / IAM 13177 / JCM 8860 / NBRC 102187 / NCIMB 2189 / SP2) TaxID=797304 RepID=A0A2J4JAW3_NATGS|nr:hypothetical protein CYV19_17020 [Natronobacterium gregoryi SP2]
MKPNAVVWVHAAVDAWRSTRVATVCRFRAAVFRFRVCRGVATAGRVRLDRPSFRPWRFSLTSIRRFSAWRLRDDCSRQRPVMRIGCRRLGVSVSGCVRPRWYGMLYRYRCTGATAGGLAVAPELTDSKPYAGH